MRDKQISPLVFNSFFLNIEFVEKYGKCSEFAWIHLIFYSDALNVNVYYYSNQIGEKVF